MAAGAYVGDAFYVENPRMAQSGFLDFKKICTLLGICTSDRKDICPSFEMTLLVADLTLSTLFLTAHASTKRAKKLRGMIVSFLQRKMLSSPDSIRVRGILGFFNTLLVGAVGRGGEPPNFSRQYQLTRRSLSRTLRAPRAAVRCRCAVSPSRYSGFTRFPHRRAH